MRAVLASLFALGLTATVHAQDMVWTHLDVTATLANDGRLNVVELHDISVKGDFSTLGRDFGLGVGQSVVVTALVRIDADGTEHPFTAGDPKKADEYAAYPTWVQWYLKDEGSVPLETTVLRYRLEYELVHAVAPAWDLPNGSKPLDALHASYWNPFERTRGVWAAWKEAWPHPESAYRLDHDVLFPSRDKVYAGLTQLDYHLHWDVATWSLVDPERAIGVATPDVDYRVQRTLRRLAPDTPAAVDLESAQRRFAAILLLPVGVLLLWFVSLLLDALRGADHKPLGPELFESTVLSEPPELIAARLGGRGRGRIGFEELLARLASERKLSVQVETPATEDAPPQVRLRLLVDRSRLHPYELEVVEGLFGSGSEITTAEIQRTQAGQEFDPEHLVSKAFARVVPARPGPSRIATGISGFLAASGFFMTVADLQRVGAQPYAPAVAALGALVARLGLPPALFWLPFFGSLLQLVPNVPLVGLASVGVTLVMLAGYQGTLARGPSIGTPAGRRLAELQRIREWARKQLARPRPALRDAWVPHLDALGLAPALAKWRKRHGGAAVSGAPDLADVSAGEALNGPPFTGEPPRAETPTDDDEWTVGFYTD